MKTCVRFTLICAWKGLTFAFEEGLLAKGNRKKCDKHNKIYKTFNFIILNAFRELSALSLNLTLINHPTGGALEHDTHMIWRVCCSLLICDSGEPPSPNSGVVFILAQRSIVVFFLRVLNSFDLIFISSDACLFSFGPDAEMRRAAHQNSDRLFHA